VQTVEGLLHGAGLPIEVKSDRLLGDPGVFVLDGRRAAINWSTMGHEAVMSHLVRDEAPLPGMAAPCAAARFLVQHMLAAMNGTPGLHVFVTHDSLVAPTAAQFLRAPLGKEDWPWYLEAAFFWRDTSGVQVRYRERVGVSTSPSVCGLDHEDVVEFARREVAQTIGLGCSARFFLAGGAFKTLLHGLPTRDLDLWAPSAADRAALVDTILARGGRLAERRTYSDAFAVGGRIVDLPDKTEPSTLAERLQRFDIGLSAIGVEYLPDDQWRPLVHPLAMESLRTRQVRLLTPLVNWRHALATLARARRYAAELGYNLPAEDEAEVWRVFDAQPAEMQQGMLDRFVRSELASDDIRREAQRRTRDASSISGSDAFPALTPGLVTPDGSRTTR